jgi:hypothetical protein
MPIREYPTASINPSKGWSRSPEWLVATNRNGSWDPPRVVRATTRSPGRYGLVAAHSDHPLALQAWCEVGLGDTRHRDLLSFCVRAFELEDGDATPRREFIELGPSGQI